MYKIKPDLINEYNRIKLKNPNLDHDLVCFFMQEMPEEAIMSLYEYEARKNNDFHIRSKDMYDKAVSCLKWFDNSTMGAKWTVDEITSLSGFVEHSYTKYDYAYIVNMIYSDSGDLKTPEMIFEEARRYLSDNDSYMIADERAYHDAIQRIKHHI